VITVWKILLTTSHICKLLKEFSTTTNEHHTNVLVATKLAVLPHLLSKLTYLKCAAELTSGSAAHESRCTIPAGHPTI